MKEGDLELLHEIAKFEDTHDMNEYKIGWSWRHVRIWPATLSRLFKDEYLENVFRSNSYTGYRLSELGRAMVAGGQDKDTDGTPQNQELALSDDLFEDIIGHDDVKELLVPVCAHRVVLDTKSKYAGVKKQDILKTLLTDIPVPI